MSAAASTSVPLPSKIPFCAVGLSYFDRLLSLNRPSELRVFGLIVVKTIGAPGRPTWSEIYDEEFQKASNVSKEQWLTALATLINFRYIKEPRHNKHTGRREYAVCDAFREESNAKTIHGKCPHCKGVVRVDHKFIPVPHIVLRKLGACLDPASFACLMVILRYTLHWHSERGVYAIPEQLDLNDFERLTGYTTRSVSMALSKLCDQDGWALVQRKDRPGKPSIYCPVIENFFRMERREVRVINQPKNRERAQKANTEKQTTPEPIKNMEESDVIESAIRPYGFCTKCDRFVTVDPMSEAEIKMERTERTESPPRAGPSRSNSTKEKQTVWDRAVQAGRDMGII